MILWLCLNGLSTGDFGEALQALVGEKAKRLSANVVVRLNEQRGVEYDEWMKRDVSEKQHVDVWADGINAKVRLEDDANNKQCLLVGTTADGKKELTRWSKPTANDAVVVDHTSPTNASP